MKRIESLILVASLGFLGACAATVPQELSRARGAYSRAAGGPAATLTPAELHKAHEALAQAEQAFASDPDSYHTRDLAYVAERKAQMAEALASIASDQSSKAKSNVEYQTTQNQIVQNTKSDLVQTREQLAASERSGQKTAEQLAAEKQARADADKKAADAEKRANDAQAALAKLAAVKQEDRGLVITLSGSVLFASDKAILLPEAQTRLDQVAEAMLATRERNAVVEGHTDSRGSESHNLDLSQRRADAVRNYLVQKGYEPDRMQAHGIGKGRPIADNNTAEGRANNRRVEIIIERGSSGVQSSNTR